MAAARSRPGHGEVARFIDTSMQDNAIEAMTGKELRMIGPFGKSPKVSNNARAVVTGAGSGIGEAFAIELALRGSRVVCSDIDEVAAKRTVSTITYNAGDAVAITCDVTKLSDVHELATESQSWFGAEPTLVINNAGVGSAGAPIGNSHRRLAMGAGHQPVGTHSRLSRLRADLAIRRTLEHSAGIINVASAAAFGAAPSMAAYNVSKAGALSLSETLAAELSGTESKSPPCAPPSSRPTSSNPVASRPRRTNSRTKLCAGLESRRTKWHKPAWTPTIAATCIACRNSKPRSAGTSNA